MALLDRSTIQQVELQYGQQILDLKFIYHNNFIIENNIT